MTKQYLITGATSGIGQQLAVDLAIEHKVIATGRNKAALNDLEKYKNISCLMFDIVSLDETQQALSQLPELDCAILNAGTCEYMDVDSFDAATFNHVIQTNVIGVANCLEMVLPKIKSGGQLVLVGSLARLLPFSKAQAYGASKIAIHYICQSLRVDLTSRDISVIEVSPGFVKTPLTDRNTFAMPMRISVEQASQSIIKGLAKNRNDVYFPSLFAWILRLLALLPNSLKIKLSRILSDD